MKTEDQDSLTPIDNLVSHRINDRDEEVLTSTGHSNTSLLVTLSSINQDFKSSNCADNVKLLEMCKILYIDLQKKTPENDLSNDTLELALLRIINDPHADRLVLEMACKVYFLLLVKRHNQIDLRSVIMKSPRAENYIVRGILATDYEFLNPDLLHDIIIESVEKCLAENSIYTTIALNNLRLFCNTYKNFHFDFRQLWRLSALHLSSRFTGSREEALNILQFIVKIDQVFGLEIARLVVEEWPWTFANKFYVLKTVIDNCTVHNGLLKCLKLTETDLIYGLSIALKHRNLYSAGQLLFRSLLRRDQIEVATRLIAEILINEDAQRLHNFHVQWSKEISLHREEIFSILNSEGLVDHSNLIVVNIFKEQIIVDEDFKLPEIDANCDPVIKQHFFDILLFRISKQFSMSEDLKLMNRFFVGLRQEQDTTLRQYVIVATTPNFITSLVNLHFRLTDENDKQSIAMFFKDLVSEVIDPSMEDSDSEYPALILSIRLYMILIKILDSSNPKAKDYEEMKAFKKHLQEKKYFVATSEKYFKLLLKLLPNAFDDVRQLATNTLVKYFPATNERRKEIQEIFCEQMYFSSFDDSRRIHGYFKILVPYYVTLKLDILKLYQEYKTLLVDNFNQHFRVDPLQAIRSGIHVFDKINIVQEIVVAADELKLSPTECLSLMRLLMDISQKMLQFLSISQGAAVADHEDDDVTPSFQVIEESLQILINNSGGGKMDGEMNVTIEPSVMDEEDNVRNRKDLLLSIWLTLKACGDLSATIVEQLKNSNDHHLEIFSVGLEINTEILHRCRHKGAIESVGLSFGRIVAHVSSTNNFLGACYQQLDKCLKLLFGSITAASYSRRGAGYSVLVLNLIKNDRQSGKPLLKKLLKEILPPDNSSERDDSLLVSVHGAFLHYLSALVKDASLTQDMLPYFKEIATLCLEKIECPDWNVKNAALQLFGALVPKLVGQRPNSGGDWEACQCTITELKASMPKIYGFMEFCVENHQKISRTLLIAVLSFLSAVEYRPLSVDELTQPHSTQLHLFRLLGHPVEKVRYLAALCFSRWHRHGQHVDLLVKLISQVFTVEDPNLQHGILMGMLLVCQKSRLECSPQWTVDRERVGKVLIEEMKFRNVSKEKNICNYNRLYLLRFIEAIELKLTDLQLDLGHIIIPQTDRETTMR